MQVLRMNTVKEIFICYLVLQQCLLFQLVYCVFNIITYRNQYLNILIRLHWYVLVYFLQFLKICRVYQLTLCCSEELSLPKSTLYILNWLFLLNSAYFTRVERYRSFLPRIPLISERHKSAYVKLYKLSSVRKKSHLNKFYDIIIKILLFSKYSDPAILTGIQFADKTTIL